MLRFLLTSMSFQNVVSQLGSQGDVHNCVSDGGYSWCDSTKSCVRMWETPCPDNYSDCGNCFERQRMGENIACPVDCDMIDPPMVIDPLPPPPRCSEVMCMMYCPDGHRLDDNGCQLCECNAINPVVSDCDLIQPTCDGYTYVCPKITEMTHCNEGGIDGYTTFRVSLVMKPYQNSRNIYAIFGDPKHIMSIPPSRQSKNGGNIGGSPPYLAGIHSDIDYDSWLSMGITSGDIDNQLSTIGIDFSTWDIHTGLEITNGAVFVMDPEDSVVSGSEYVIGQFTILRDSNPEIIFNVQGKPNDIHSANSWSEYNIRFHLVSPVTHDTIPLTCISWYDGCNTCDVNHGVIGSCTRMMCFREDTPQCLSFIGTGH